MAQDASVEKHKQTSMATKHFYGQDATNKIIYAKIKIYLAGLAFDFAFFLGGWEGALSPASPSVSVVFPRRRFLVGTVGAAAGAGATFAFGAAFALTIFKALQIGEVCAT